MTKSDILQDISVSISKTLKRNLSDIKKLDTSDRKEIEKVIQSIKDNLDIISNIG